MKGRTNERMVVRANERRVEQTNQPTNEPTNQRTNERTTERTNEPTNQRRHAGLRSFLPLSREFAWNRCWFVQRMHGIRTKPTLHCQYIHRQPTMKQSSVHVMYNTWCVECSCSADAMHTADIVVRTSLYVVVRTSLYVVVRRCTSLYVIVRRCTSLYVVVCSTSLQSMLRC